MTDEEHEAEQKELRDKEPEAYEILRDGKHKFHEFGDTFRTIGVATNLGAGGYCDKNMVVVADDVTDPKEFIEVCVHEALHAVFPELTEKQVDRAGRQIGEFVWIMLRFKGVKLSTLKKFGPIPMGDELGPFQRGGRAGCQEQSDVAPSE